MATVLLLSLRNAAATAVEDAIATSTTSTIVKLPTMTSPSTPSSASSSALPNPAATVIATVWTLWSFATLFLALRIYCRTYMYRTTKTTTIWWDDFVLILGYVFLTAANALITVLQRQGFGMTLEFTAHMHTLAVTMDVVNKMALVLTKTSFAITLLRMMAGWYKGLVWFLVASMWLIVGSNAVTTWFAACERVGIDHYETVLPNTCWAIMNSIVMALVSNSYSAIVDFILALLAWKIAMGLQMKSHERLAVGFAMSLGVLAGLVGAIKVYKITTIVKPPNIPYNLSLIFIWGQAEPCATIAATSIPMLRVLFRRGDAGAVATQHRQRPHSDEYYHHQQHEHYNYQSYAYSHPGLTAANSDAEGGCTAGGTRDSTATTAIPNSPSTTTTTASKVGMHNHHHPWRLSYKAGVTASFVTASRGWSWMRRNSGFSNTDTIVSTAHHHDRGGGEGSNGTAGITSATATTSAAATATDACSTLRQSSEVCYEIISLEQFLAGSAAAADGVSRAWKGGSSIGTAATLDEEKEARRCSSKASSRHDSFYQEHCPRGGRTSTSTGTSGRDVVNRGDIRSSLQPSAGESAGSVALMNLQSRGGGRDDRESNISTKARHSEDTCTQGPVFQHDAETSTHRRDTTGSADIQPSGGGGGGGRRSRNNTNASDTATETYQLLPDCGTAGTETKGGSIK